MNSYTFLGLLKPCGQPLFWIIRGFLTPLKWGLMTAWRLVTVWWVKRYESINTAFSSFFSGLFSPLFFIARLLLSTIPTRWRQASTFARLASLYFVKFTTFSKSSWAHLRRGFLFVRGVVRVTFSYLICNLIGQFMAYVWQLLSFLDSNYIRLSLLLYGRSCHDKMSGRDAQRFKRAQVRRRWYFIQQLSRSARRVNLFRCAIEEKLKVLGRSGPYLLDAVRRTRTYSFIHSQNFFPQFWFSIRLHLSSEHCWSSQLGNYARSFLWSWSTPNSAMYFYDVYTPWSDWFGVLKQYLPNWYSLSIVWKGVISPADLYHYSYVFLVSDISRIYVSSYYFLRRLRYNLRFYIQLFRILGLHLVVILGELFESPCLVVFFALLHLSYQLLFAVGCGLSRILQRGSRYVFMWVQDLFCDWVIRSQLAWINLTYHPRLILNTLCVMYDPTTYLISILELCERLTGYFSEGLYFVGYVLLRFTSYTLFTLSRLFVIAHSTVLRFVRWYIGPKACKQLWTFWVDVVEYHEDIVEEAFTPWPPKGHPDVGLFSKVYFVRVRMRTERKTGKRVPRLLPGQKPWPRLRGFWSKNKVVRAMRWTKLIYHKFRCQHRLNSEIRWQRVYYFLAFIEVIEVFAGIYWVIAGQHLEMAVLRFRIWRRWKVLVPTLNAIRNLEAIFMSYTFDPLFSKHFVPSIGSAKFIIETWCTKWLNLFSNSHKLLMNLAPFLRKVTKVIDNFERVLGTLRVGTCRNVENLDSFQRGWLAQHDLFLLQVSKVIDAYVQSGYNVSKKTHAPNPHHWTEFVNYSTSVEASWITGGDPNPKGVDSARLYWLAGLSGHSVMDKALIDVTSGLFSLQNTLLREINHLIKSVDSAVFDVDFILRLELDLLSVEDTLFKLKQSLHLLHEGVLGMDTLSIHTLREKYRLIIVRDRLLHLARAAFVHKDSLRREIDKLVQIHEKLQINTPVCLLDVLKQMKGETDQWVLTINAQINNVLTHSKVPTIWDNQQWEQNVEDLIAFKTALTSFKMTLRRGILALSEMNTKLMKYSSSEYVTALMKITSSWHLLRRELIAQTTDLMSYSDFLLESPEHCTLMNANFTRVLSKLNLSVSKSIDLTKQLETLSKGSFGGDVGLVAIREEVLALRRTITDVRDVLPLFLSLFTLTFGLPILYCFLTLPLWLCLTFFTLIGPVWYCLLQLIYVLYKVDDRANVILQEDDKVYFASLFKDTHFKEPPLPFHEWDYFEQMRKKEWFNDFYRN